jgi:hypothetical protein
MTPRNFDTPITIKSKATVTSLYSNREYSGEDFPDLYFSVLENSHYVFRDCKITYKVSPKYVAIEKLA